MYNRDINEIFRNSNTWLEWHTWRDHSNNKSEEGQKQVLKKYKAPRDLFSFPKKRDKTKKLSRI